MMQSAAASASAQGWPPRSPSQHYSRRSASARPIAAIAARLALAAAIAIVAAVACCALAPPAPATSTAALHIESAATHVAPRSVAVTRAPLGDGTGSGGDFGSVAPIYIVVGSASMVAAMLVAAVFCGSPTVHNDHPSLLILTITLCDMGYTAKFMLSALAWVAGARDERDSFHFIPDDCRTSAAWGQFMGMASISWNACWIFDFFCVLRDPLRNTSSQRRWYHLFVWSLCLATTIYVVAVGAHVNAADHTCWLRGDPTNLLVFDVPLYVFVAMGGASLVYALYRLRGGTPATRAIRCQLFTRHLAYIVAFVGLWLWPIVHHSIDAEDTLPWLTSIDAFVVSCQALIFAIIRLSEPGARALVRALLARWWAKISGCATAVCGACACGRALLGCARASAAFFGCCCGATSGVRGRGSYASSYSQAQYTLVDPATAAALTSGLGGGAGGVGGALGAMGYAPLDERGGDEYTGGKSIAIPGGGAGSVSASTAGSHHHHDAPRFTGFTAHSVTVSDSLPRSASVGAAGPHASYINPLLTAKYGAGGGTGGGAAGNGGIIVAASRYDMRRGFPTVAPGAGGHGNGGAVGNGGGLAPVGWVPTTTTSLGARDAAPPLGGDVGSRTASSLSRDPVTGALVPLPLTHGSSASSVGGASIMSVGTTISPTGVALSPSRPAATSIAAARQALMLEDARAASALSRTPQGARRASGTPFHASTGGDDVHGDGDAIVSMASSQTQVAGGSAVAGGASRGGAFSGLVRYQDSSPRPGADSGAFASPFAAAPAGADAGSSSSGGGGGVVGALVGAFTRMLSPPQPSPITDVVGSAGDGDDRRQPLLTAGIAPSGTGGIGSHGTPAGSYVAPIAPAIAKLSSGRSNSGNAGGPSSARTDGRKSSGSRPAVAAGGSGSVRSSGEAEGAGKPRHKHRHHRHRHHDRAADGSAGAGSAEAPRKSRRRDRTDREGGRGAATVPAPSASPTVVVRPSLTSADLAVDATAALAETRGSVNALSPDAAAAANAAVAAATLPLSAAATPYMSSPLMAAATGAATGGGSGSRRGGSEVGAQASSLPSQAATSLPSRGSSRSRSRSSSTSSCSSGSSSGSSRSTPPTASPATSPAHRNVSFHGLDPLTTQNSSQFPHIQLPRWAGDRERLGGDGVMPPPTTLPPGRPHAGSVDGAAHLYLEHVLPGGAAVLAGGTATGDGPPRPPSPGAAPAAAPPIGKAVLVPGSKWTHMPVAMTLPYGSAAAAGGDASGEDSTAALARTAPPPPTRKGEASILGGAIAAAAAAANGGRHPTSSGPAAPPRSGASLAAAASGTAGGGLTVLRARSHSDDERGLAAPPRASPPPGDHASSGAATRPSPSPDGHPGGDASSHGGDGGDDTAGDSSAASDVATDPFGYREFDIHDVLRSMSGVSAAGGGMAALAKAARGAAVDVSDRPTIAPARLTRLSVQPASSPDTTATGSDTASVATSTTAGTAAPGEARDARPPTIARGISSDALDASAAVGWDVGHALRLERALCVLSGVCQAVLNAEARQRAAVVPGDASAGPGAGYLRMGAPLEPVVERAGGGAATEPETPTPDGGSGADGGGPSSSSTPSGWSTSGAASPTSTTDATPGAGAPPAAVGARSIRQDVNAWLRHPSTVTEDLPLMQEMDCESYLATAAARYDSPTGRRGGGIGGADGAGDGGAGDGLTVVGRVARALNKRSSLASKFELASFMDAEFAELRAAAALHASSIVYALDPVLLRMGELRAHFSEGASTSFFCRSLDQLLVVKTIGESEVRELLALMPLYREHLLTNPDSLLCRFYGCYALKMPSSPRVYFLLMGNVFPVVEPGPRAETYDLKGSTIGRRARVSKSLLSRGKGGETVAKGVLYQDLEFRERYPHGLPACHAAAAEAFLAAGTCAAPGGDGGDGGAAGFSDAGPLSPTSSIGGGSGMMAGGTVVLDDLMLGLPRSQAIVAQLMRDVTLLASAELMDYSLLINVQPIQDSDVEPYVAAVAAATEGGSAGSGAPFASPPTASFDALIADDPALSAAGGASSAASPFDLAITFRLSLNKTPTLTMRDALTLVKAATALPRQIAACSLAAQARAGGGSARGGGGMRTVATRASLATTPAALRNRMTRWSSLAVSVCALGMSRTGPPLARGTSAGAASGDGGAAVPAAPPTLPAGLSSFATGDAAHRSGPASTSSLGGGGGGGDGDTSPRGSSSNGGGGAQREGSQFGGAAGLWHRMVGGGEAAHLARARSDGAVDTAVGFAPPRHASPGADAEEAGTAPLAAPAGALSRATTAGAAASPLRPPLAPLASPPLRGVSSGPSTPRSGGSGGSSHLLSGGGSRLGTYRRRALVQIGIIDVLQAYDTSKRVENRFKVLRYALAHAGAAAGADISSVDPHLYADRFMRFVEGIFLPAGAAQGGGGSMPTLAEVPPDGGSEAAARRVG